MYKVSVIVEHDGKEVFREFDTFTDNEDRDYMRAFLSRIGNNIESYDMHFDDDNDPHDLDPKDFGYMCPHDYYVNVAGCPLCGVR